MQYHPDKNPHTQALFQIVHAAYEVLSDPTARANYDDKVMTLLKPQRAPAPAGERSYKDIYNEWRQGGMRYLE